MQHIPGLYFGSSNKEGIGVFTAQDIQDEDLIEICPLLFIPGDQRHLIDKTVFFNYYFIWPGDQFSICLALGYGSLYNHSISANAEVTFDIDEKIMLVTAIEKISAGEEIYINYRGGGKSEESLWFEVR